MNVVPAYGIPEQLTVFDLTAIPYPVGERVMPVWSPQYMCFVPESVMFFAFCIVPKHDVTPSNDCGVSLEEGIEAVGLGYDF